MSLSHHFNEEFFVSRIDVENILKSFGRISLPTLLLKSELTEEEIKSVAELFEPWTDGEAVKVDFFRQFQGELYLCVQAHTTQSTWTPDATPALWTCKSLPGVISDWVQPTGATDAYSTGDQVQYDSQVWESKIDANTTVPDGDVPYNRYWDIVE